MNSKGFSLIKVLPILLIIIVGAILILSLLGAMEGKILPGKNFLDVTIGNLRIGFLLVSLVTGIIGGGIVVGLVMAFLKEEVLSHVVEFISGEDVETTEDLLAIIREMQEAQPGRISPVWEIGRAHLKAYFSRNLRQVTVIFVVSIGVMIIGFAIIFLGIIIALFSPASPVPATLATVSGLITEFIGATFLLIYRTTMQQAAGYVQTIERINSVGMAMQILDTMPEQSQTDDLKSKTKAVIAEQLIRQAYGGGSSQTE
jgi:xanthosine utilization system XapX-like protein